MDKINSRKVAYEILREIEERESYSNIVLSNYFKKHNLSAMDRGFITQLVYGVLERKLTLDFYISRFSKTKLKKIHVDIRHILRIAVYQIVYLDKTPNSAAVNEAVNLTKKVNYKSSGFVNGVLRQLIRGYETVSFPNPKSHLPEYLSTKYSHSKWIGELLIREYGGKKAESILKANIETPELSIRVNTLVNSRQELMDELTTLGLTVEVSKMSDMGLIVKSLGGNSLDRLKPFVEGRFIVQDESSMLVANTLNPKSGDRVLDVCSAPGGKSTHMAQVMDNKGTIIACDVYDHKLDRIRENADKLNISIIETQNVDGTEFKSDWDQSFDKVLVDAPCSGLGIIRRKPEIKYLKTLDDVKELSEIQYEILQNSSKYVKIDGDLVYSTCTITLEENEEIIDKFIKSNDNYQLNGNYIKILPGEEGSDGFFICKMKRVR